jgi:molybdopterin molybdotransferase
MRSVAEHQGVVAGLIAPQPATQGLVPAAEVTAPVSLRLFDNAAMDANAVLNHYAAESDLTVT